LEFVICDLEFSWATNKKLNYKQIVWPILQIYLLIFMGEINFLSNNKNGAAEDRPEQKKGEAAVEWSKPSVDKQKEGKKGFVWLDAFAKIKNLRQKSKQSDAKAKIKRSRQAVLELIKRHQEQAKKKAPALASPVKNKIVNWASGSWLDWFKSLFKKKSHQDILIDYQQVFTQKKEKRGTISSLATDKIFTGSKAVPEQPVAAKSAPAAKSEISSPVEFRPIKSREEVKPPLVEPTVVKPIEPKVAKVKDAKAWQNPNIVGTNLIKSEIITYFDWRSKIIILINAIVLSCLVIGLVYGGLIFLQKQNTAKNELLERKFAELENQLKQVEKNSNEILAWQKKLKVADALLAQHIYWTNFFKFLEENTLSDVYFVNFSGTTSGSYALNAMAKNYDTISQQINILMANSKVTRAESNGGQMAGQGETSGVSFVLNIAIKPDIFTE